LSQQQVGRYSAVDTLNKETYRETDPDTDLIFFTKENPEIPLEPALVDLDAADKERVIEG